MRLSVIIFNNNNTKLPIILFLRIPVCLLMKYLSRCMEGCRFGHAPKKGEGKQSFAECADQTLARTKKSDRIQ